MSVFDNLFGSIKNSITVKMQRILLELSTGSKDRSFSADKASVTKIAFDLLTLQEIGEGEMAWNAEDGTLDLGLPGGNVTLQINEETVMRAVNKTGSDIPNGTAVYVSGGQGSRPRITKADADSLASSGVIGFTTELIGDNASGYVTVTGLVRDVDTSGCTAGDTLWLSQAAGEWSNVRPTSPATQVVVGVCIFASAGDGVIFVKVDLVPRLVGLSDVIITNLADGDIMVYDSASTTWQNQQPV